MPPLRHAKLSAIIYSECFSLFMNYAQTLFNLSKLDWNLAQNRASKQDRKCLHNSKKYNNQQK